MHFIRFTNSSNLAGASWDNETLIIEFKRGGSYQYDDVPEEIYNELIEADSPGSYYHKNIKGQYDCTKL